jgi:thiol:disulfide interchange protein DsbD
MVWVRKIFGFILVAMAFYFARSVIGPRYAAIGYALTCLAAGLYLGWLDRSEKGGRGFKALRRVIGAAGIALAVLFAFTAVRMGEPGAGKKGIVWTPFTVELMEQAARDGKPAVIDFTAEWCVLCHELERGAFTDPGVIALSLRASMLRVDITRPGAIEREIQGRFGIRGAPIIIFIDRTGQERGDLRVTGIVSAAELSRRLEEIIGGGASAGTSGGTSGPAGASAGTSGPGGAR